MDCSSSEGIRHGYRYAVRAFTELVAVIDDDAWGRPALGVWTVRDLVGHTSRALLTVDSYLDPTRTAEVPDLPDAAAYFRVAQSALADPVAVAERGRQAGAALGDDPAATVADLAERVLGRIEAAPDDALVSTPVGTMTLAGYLPTRTFELVVHGLDLAGALGVDPPAALTEPIFCCLQLAATLAGARPDAAQLLLALTGRQPLPTGFSVV